MIEGFSPRPTHNPDATIPRMKQIFLLIPTLLAAQALAPEVEITAEPHHHLVLENKSVRVFNVDVPPHTDTLMHWHRHDYIYVTLGDAEVVNAVKDKPPATLKLQDAETRFSPATFAHIARNLSDQPFRNVTIEILEDETLRHAPSPRVADKDADKDAHKDSNQGSNKNEDRALVLFPGGTQQILFVKDAIRVSEFELQPGAAASVTHPHGPLLLVAASDVEVRSRIRHGSASTALSSRVALKPGDSKWYPANNSHTVANPGPKLAKFVTLEFP
jgi:quercetin dioxygenase-like cupin family protein